MYSIIQCCHEILLLCPQIPVLFYGIINNTWLAKKNHAIIEKYSMYFSVTDCRRPLKSFLSDVSKLDSPEQLRYMYV